MALRWTLKLTAWVLGEVSGVSCICIENCIFLQLGVDVKPPLACPTNLKAVRWLNCSELGQISFTWWNCSLVYICPLKSFGPPLSYICSNVMWLTCSLRPGLSYCCHLNNWNCKNWLVCASFLLCQKDLICVLQWYFINVWKMCAHTLRGITDKKVYQPHGWTQYFHFTKKKLSTSLFYYLTLDLCLYWVDLVLHPQCILRWWYDNGSRIGEKMVCFSTLKTMQAS